MRYQRLAVIIKKPDILVGMPGCEFNFALLLSNHFLEDWVVLPTTGPQVGDEVSDLFRIESV